MPAHSPLKSDGLKAICDAMLPKAKCSPESELPWLEFQRFAI
jgi:hypothetical protein